MRYFLKTVAGQWEEVNSYIFENRKFAVTSDNKVRFGNEFVQIENCEVTFSGKFSVSELGKVCRFIGVQPVAGSFGPGGIFTTPESIILKKGRSTILHCIKTGENWKRK